MTAKQYSGLMSVLRRIDSNTHEVAERLRWLYPSQTEIREQIDAELNSILGCGVKVFEGE